MPAILEFLSRQVVAGAFLARCRNRGARKTSGVAEIAGSTMRKVFIIGISAGNPDYVTVQAINALNEVDVFFIPNKGTEKAALRNLRTQICERFIKEKTYRFVDVEPLKRTNEFSDYKSNVEEWHTRVEESYEGLLMEGLADGECGAFLVWGDPTLYDSTLRIIERIRSKAGFAHERPGEPSNWL